MFDTYDTPEQTKTSVRKYTDKIHHLTTVEKHGKKHRPPVLRLHWGGYFFQGVLERLEQQFTMFMEDGTPVRATCRCTFKEWRTNYDDLNKQKTESADVAKVWIAKRGDSLSSIAFMEYNDPRLWRPIADANNLDDPLSLTPGTQLLIPTLTQRNARG
jgi:nucleoid-associated protein YgaU